MNKRARLRIAGIENDSIVDGPGLRLTVFTQGCPHKCPGCHNPQSHSMDGGYVVYTGDIMIKVDQNPLLDGVTFSGGEPFLQYEEITELSREIKSRGLNVMVYTGYTWEEIMSEYEKYKLFLDEIDILVDGRFVKEQKSYKLAHRGSKNQRIIDVKESLESGRAVEMDAERLR